ncbi:DNA-binding HxlR family transcriptional regulator [Dyadobacter sp. BE34]|uniref:DNA-binding HxlR family transcriptional regulator n=1 Tax=Dyadobacter fermentans TaxID=94254 RepID=A0ABU1QWA0_9BACT|nr:MULTISPECIES: winged helix-turn-helix transcriptional regulator [Dyadobacter]MDR6805411.1 DNA-binding HxlR family transcriptional regulator [Dyadobacter fermentans]MDR7042829.1 DNA-binding HxlR family transcriptional regulator [Dyadobacter sp. BE242]MDR7197141.1 DNA-binding HxlR family transcriptional regulator [Dyadobacter sp. BE34]MDR7215424.1 DNA-binding HxlR family transcriptional regulator [Dyadobacter sp. BE31]MDR7262960.1 DNA-binding HxlR family transcriptional regulator [Dyadobacter
MTKIKENSTYNANREIVMQECPVTYVMNKIGGHWKPIILYHLLAGSKRYSEIKKAMPHITEKMLIQHLKQLESDRLLIREAKPVVPPYVTYTLTDGGKELESVINAMAEWAYRDIKRNNEPEAAEMAA